MPKRIILLALSILVAACQRDTNDAASTPPAGQPAPMAGAAGPAFAVASEIPEKLIGRWRSVDDPKAGLNITDDAWVFTYEPPDSLQDRVDWRIFPGTSAPTGAPYSFTPASTYLELTDPNGFSQYYEFDAVDRDFFAMFYLGRGNRLAYRRVD